GRQVVRPAEWIRQLRRYHLSRSHGIGRSAHRKLLLALCCYLSDLRDRSVCLGLRCGPSRTAELGRGAELYRRDCRNVQLGRLLQMPASVANALTIKSIISGSQRASKRLGCESI